MADVDLIPADYAKRARVRRRVKPLVLTLVGIALIIGAARLALYVLIGFENENIAQLEKKSQVAAITKAQADDFRQQSKLAEKQLAELDELRGRDRLKLLLQAIDAAHRDSIWIDSLRFIRRDVPSGESTPLPGGGRSGTIVVPKGNVSLTANAPASASVEQRAEIIGHATSHTELAEFMRGLGSQPGIAEVRLIDTGLGSYGHVPVIDVTLLLLIDDKIRKPQ